MSRSVLIADGGQGLGQAVARTPEGGKDRATARCRTGAPPAGMPRLHSEGTGPAHVETVVFADQAVPGPVEAAVVSADFIRHSLPLRMIHNDVAPMLVASLGAVGAACRLAKRAGRGMILLPGGRPAVLSCTSGLIGFVWSLAREFDRGQVALHADAPGPIGNGMTVVCSQPPRAAVIIPFPVRSPHSARPRR